MKPAFLLCRFLTPQPCLPCPAPRLQCRASIRAAMDEEYLKVHVKCTEGEAGEMEKAFAGVCTPSS